MFGAEESATGLKDSNKKESMALAMVPPKNRTIGGSRPQMTNRL